MPDDKPKRRKNTLTNPAQWKPHAPPFVLKPEHIQKFLEALMDYPHISEAAAKSGATYNAFYNLRKKDPDFAAAWKEAQDIGMDRLEDEATRRAHSGWDEPVYQSGILVGHVRKYSDSLMMFLLKGKDKFKEKVVMEHSGPGGKPIQTTAVELKTDDPIEAARIYQKMMNGDA